MKENKWIFIERSAMWLSCGAAIVCAMQITQSVIALWFFLIPAVVSCSIYTKTKEPE